MGGKGSLRCSGLSPFCCLPAETYGMTLPTTAQDIYDLLTADSVISDALGAYSIPGGDILPAISVFAGGDGLPSGTVTDGLEIVISALPGYAPQVLLTEESLTNPTWRLYVVAWSSLGALQAVAERIITLLPGASCTQLQKDAPGEGLGVMDQVVIRWTNPCAVVTA